MIVVKVDNLNESYVDYTANSKPKYLRSYEGMPVFVYSHADERYEQRVSKIPSKFGIDTVDKNELYLNVLKLAGSNKSELSKLSRNEYKRLVYRYLYVVEPTGAEKSERLYYEVAVIMNCSYPKFKNKDLRFELSRLIRSKSDEVNKFLYDNASDDYKNYIIKGFIDANKPMLSIETVVTSLSNKFPSTFSNTNVDYEENRVVNKTYKLSKSELIELKKTTYGK